MRFWVAWDLALFIAFLSEGFFGLSAGNYFLVLCCWFFSPLFACLAMLNQFDENVRRGQE